MLRPGGEITISSPFAPTITIDTFTCAHCQRIVRVPPRANPSDMGGWCASCAKCICPRCVGRSCTPWEKKMERMEARDRFLRSAGILLLLWALLTNPLWAQPAPTFGPEDAVLFDYYTADIATYAVRRYEVQWDGGPWSSLGLPTAYTTPQTPSGAVTYKVPPPFSTGNHTAAFRACNAQRCGAGSVQFRFREAKR